MNVLRAGHDVALLAVGKMVSVAEKAADLLAQRGVSTTVVDARFVKPIDPEIAPLAARHRAVITIEDGTATGGFGSAVTELLAAEGVSVPLRRLGLPDHFIEHGAQAKLLHQFGLDADAVAATALELVPASSALAG
jgi:1-deoxy-D-xylulose-5-phosphate synthase